MAFDKRISSQGGERNDLLDAVAAPAVRPARPRRKVNQTAIRRLFLDAAPLERQSGKIAASRESRMAIVLPRPTRLRTAPLEQVFSTPFRRL